jgi:putative transposase
MPVNFGKLVDHDHPELSVSRRCTQLGLPRSALYYRPTPAGIPISRDRVRNLMRRMGLRAIYQNPRTTVHMDPSER